MANLPKRFERFLKEYPEIATAYEQLGDAIHKEGSLNERERALVKLAPVPKARPTLKLGKA